jgi:hypothetical protein
MHLPACFLLSAATLRVRLVQADAVEVEVEHHVLVFDSPDGELQRLALDLIGRDFDVHYANDVDEAQMLARDETGRINAVLFASSIELEHIPDMAKRFGVATSSLVSIGPRPPEEVVAALAHHGVRWHLWDGPSDESIRFVLSNVLFEQDDLEIRFHRRVPVSHPAQLEVDDTKGDLMIRDLSRGGACLMGDFLGVVGTQGTLHFSIDNDPIDLPITIAWAAGEPGDDLRVAGVTFLEVSPSAGAAIDAMMDSFMSKHRITKAV